MDIFTINNYNSLLENLKLTYRLETCSKILGENPDEIISLFLISKIYEEFTVHDCYCIPNINNDNIYFGALAIGYKVYEKGKLSTMATELHCFIIKELSSTFANMLIRPETIADKILDIISKSDIDFEDFPDFSSKYCFLSKNKDEARRFANNVRLQAISEQDRINIEINKNLLYATYDRIITAEDCKNIIEFAKKI